MVDEDLTVERLEAALWIASYLGPITTKPTARQKRTIGIEPRVQASTELPSPCLVVPTGMLGLTGDVRQLDVDGPAPAAHTRWLP